MALAGGLGIGKVGDPAFLRLIIFIPLSTYIGILVLGKNRMSFLLYERNSGEVEFSLLFYFQFIVLINSF